MGTLSCLKRTTQLEHNHVEPIDLLFKCFFCFCFFFFILEMLSKVPFFDYEIPAAQNSYALCKVRVYLHLLLIKVTQVGRRNSFETEEKMEGSGMQDSGIREGEVLIISFLSHPNKAEVLVQPRTSREVHRGIAPGLSRYSLFYQSKPKLFNTLDDLEKRKWGETCEECLQTLSSHSTLEFSLSLDRAEYCKQSYMTANVGGSRKNTLVMLQWKNRSCESVQYSFTNDLIFYFRSLTLLSLSICHQKYLLLL